jgi:FMN phosphatase YigB (HAD superfamily)
MRVLAFDVYGTLVDVQGIEKTAEPFLSVQSSAFIARWLEKTVAFSNGTTKTVNQILSAAQLAGYFRKSSASMNSAFSNRIPWSTHILRDRLLQRFFDSVQSRQ